MKPVNTSRQISKPVQRMLWGKAAGRCEFAGCNKPLWRSSVTQEEVNIAEKAHIHAFSEEGPRSESDLPCGEVNQLSNLMLVCHECHRKMDRESGADRYPADVLRKMKDCHERRIEMVSGIDTKLHTHVLLYGANIGRHSAPLSFNLTAPCIFPHRYPAEEKAIELGTVNSSLTDGDELFWRVEREHLCRMFVRRVRDRVMDGTIEHLSVFALAPQPLLVLLGSLLTDIVQTDVYQFHREPQGWAWAEDAAPTGFTLVAPEVVSGPPVLVLSLSASVHADRIREVVGQNVTFWAVKITPPGNDFLRSRAQLREFRELMRSAMDRIKRAHGQDAILHVFPAVPAAVAVELGRVHMPKADLRLRVYDQIKSRGFVPAIDIPVEDE